MVQQPLDTTTALVTKKMSLHQIILNQKYYCSQNVLLGVSSLEFLRNIELDAYNVMQCLVPSCIVLTSKLPNIKCPYIKRLR